MAELIKMQFGMLSWVGPGNMYYIGVKMPPRKGALNLTTLNYPKGFLLLKMWRKIISGTAS